MSKLKQDFFSGAMAMVVFLLLFSIVALNHIIACLASLVPIAFVAG